MQLKWMRRCKVCVPERFRSAWVRHHRQWFIPLTKFKLQSVTTCSLDNKRGTSGEDKKPEVHTFA